MIPPNGATLIVITPLSGNEGPTLTPYSARNATQTLEQIAGGGTPRRTINGNMVNLTHPQFRKYQSIISCSDFEVPALDNSWVGMSVEVQCAAELAFLTGGTPARPVVSGSDHVEGHFTYYRPVLNMMVMSIKNTFKEWETLYSWQMELAEI